MIRKTSYLETILKKKKKNKSVVLKEREGEKEYLKALFKDYFNNSPRSNQRMNFLLQKF